MSGYMERFLKRHLIRGYRPHPPTKAMYKYCILFRDLWAAGWGITGSEEKEMNAWAKENFGYELIRCVTLNRERYAEFGDPWHGAFVFDSEIDVLHFKLKWC